MKDTLIKFVEICDKLEIQYFLHLGTCLGLYRDGNFFPNDDLDVGVICNKEKLKELFKTIKEAKFREGDVFINPGCELNYHWWSEDNVLLDIHFQFLKEEEKFLESFGTVRVWDREFFIPYPVWDYLELEYNKLIGERGGDWRKKSQEKSRPLAKANEMSPKKSLKMDIEEYYNHKGIRYEWDNVKNLYTDETGKMLLKPKGEVTK